MSELVNKARKIALILIFGILILIFFTIYFPLQRDIHHIQLINWSLIAQSRTYSLQQFIEKSREAAHSISSRTVIRERIEEYLAKQITWDELQAFTQPKYEDGIRVLEDLALAYRVVEGKILVEVNPSQPVQLIDTSLLVTENIPESEIVISQNEHFLLVSSPIQTNDVLLGYDVLFFRLSPVLNAISDQGFKIQIIHNEDGNEIKALKQIEEGENYQIFQNAGTIYYLEQIPRSQHFVLIQALYMEIIGPVQWRINSYLLVFFICLILIFFLANQKMFQIANSLLKELESSKEHYRFQATTDTLTGALSRFSLTQWLEHSRRETSWKDPTAIAMIDINQFKEINDQYGHETGDAVLCKLVEITKATIRKEDLLIRYGGDEFLIIFDHLGQEQAKKIMQRLEEKIEKNGKYDFPLSISYGIEEVRRVDDFDNALKKADEKMYLQKQGRKQT